MAQPNGMISWPRCRWFGPMLVVINGDDSAQWHGMVAMNLSAVLLCHTVNISALYKHCTIALPISAIIIIDVLASYKCHGDDQWRSVFRASCSADRCESLGSCTL